MALEFGIQTDLYAAGKTEDGYDYTAEVYYIVAEDEHGNRWRHYASFKGCEVGVTEDGWNSFGDIRAEAMAKAERLLARIEAAGGKIFDKYWQETRPAYGSRAYQAYGMFDDWMEEQMERYN